MSGFSMQNHLIWCVDSEYHIKKGKLDKESENKFVFRKYKSQHRPPKTFRAYKEQQLKKEGTFDVYSNVVNK